MSNDRYWSILACGWVDWDPVTQHEVLLHDVDGWPARRPVPEQRRTNEDSAVPAPARS
jgi:hypothetical protein